MDLFDIKLRLEVSRSYSVRNKLTVLNVYIFRILYASGGGMGICGVAVLMFFLNYAVMRGTKSHLAVLR